jgi:hypothetical protein
MEHVVLIDVDIFVEERNSIRFGRKTLEKIIVMVDPRI